MRCGGWRAWRSLGLSLWIARRLASSSRRAYIQRFGAQLFLRKFLGKRCTGRLLARLLQRSEALNDPPECSGWRQRQWWIEPSSVAQQTEVLVWCDWWWWTWWWCEYQTRSLFPGCGLVSVLGKPSVDLMKDVRNLT